MREKIRAESWELAGRKGKNKGQERKRGGEKE